MTDTQRQTDLSVVDAIPDEQGRPMWPSELPEKWRAEADEMDREAENKGGLAASFFTALAQRDRRHAFQLEAALRAKGLR